MISKLVGCFFVLTFILKYLHLCSAQYVHDNMNKLIWRKIFFEGQDGLLCRLIFVTYFLWRKGHLKRIFQESEKSMDQSDSRGNDSTLQDLGFGPEEDEEMGGMFFFDYLVSELTSLRKENKE